MVGTFSKPVLVPMLGVMLLAACNPQSMETEPVKVQTETGTVICQLYNPRMLYWDRSIDRPQSMTVQQADAICAAKGREIAKGGAG